VGATLRTRRRGNQTPTSRRHDVWGSARLPQGGEAPLPLPWGLGRRCGCSRRCHRRTPSRLRGARWHLSSTRRHLRGARRFSHGLPGDGRSCARPKRCLLGRLRGSGRGGAGSHLSGRARPPSLPSSSSSSDDEYSEVTGEDSPCCSRSRNSSLLCSRRSRCRILFSFLCAASSCSRHYAARALALGAWAGRTARRSRSPAAGNKRKVRPRRRIAREWRERRQKLHSPAGPRGS
jgi:hypothetical protein